MPDLKVLFSDLIRFETDLWNASTPDLRSDHDLPLTWFEPDRQVDVEVHGMPCL